MENYTDLMDLHEYGMLRIKHVLAENNGILKVNHTDLMGLHMNGAMVQKIGMLRINKLRKNNANYCIQ